MWKPRRTDETGSWLPPFRQQETESRVPLHGEQICDSRLERVIGSYDSNLKLLSVVPTANVVRLCTCSRANTVVLLLSCFRLDSTKPSRVSVGD